MVFPFLGVILPVFWEVDSWLRTPSTKVGQIPFSWLLSIVTEPKLDNLFHVLPLALDTMEFSIAILVVFLGESHANTVRGKEILTGTESWNAGLVERRSFW